MNILITGGLGYIGGRLSNYLKEKRPDTRIFLTTVNKNRKLPSWTEKFTIVQMDLLNEDSVSDCLNNKNIDIIIHLAALNEIESMKSPELALEVNTKGTYKLLKLANINHINKFIYFSTFHVYGGTSSPIITEETPTKPFHPYAITHRAAEDFVNYFRHYQNMKTVIFRLSNGYGYPMDKDVNRWTLVFNDLCKQVITTGKIVLKSSGKQHRDFISLNNIARAVYHFIFVIPDSWEKDFYNLGGNCSWSVLDVAQKIADVYKSKYKKDILKIEIQKDNSSDAFQPIKYSIERLEKTGFRLEDNINYEIEKTMELCEEFLT